MSRFPVHAGHPPGEQVVGHALPVEVAAAEASPFRVGDSPHCPVARGRPLDQRRHSLKLANDLRIGEPASHESTDSLDEHLVDSGTRNAAREHRSRMTIGRSRLRDKTVPKAEQSLWCTSQAAGS
jgi:hypothetical protein